MKIMERENSKRMQKKESVREKSNEAEETYCGTREERNIEIMKKKKRENSNELTLTSFLLLFHSKRELQRAGSKPRREKDQSTKGDKKERRGGSPLNALFSFL